jgi:hypothetical protein
MIWTIWNSFIMRFLYSHHLFIQLSIYIVWTHGDLCFLLLWNCLFIFLLKVFPLWEVRVLSVDFCFLLTYSNCGGISRLFCFVFRTLLLSGLTICSRHILPIFWLSSGISHFSEEFWFFLLENGIVKWRSEC